MKFQILKEAPPRYYQTMSLAQINFEGSTNMCLAQKWKAQDSKLPDAWVLVPGFVVGKENLEAEPEVKNE